MATKVLNIEVGDRLTKVCMTASKGKSYQIRSSFMFQTPDNAVSDGQISDPAGLGAALRAQIDSHELSDVKRVVFALTSGKVASREVMLPPVKENRLKELVTTNASDYFPVDLSKYHVTYSFLERVVKGENPGCRVLVLAAPLSLLEGYFTMSTAAGLTVQAIDFSGNSQYRALCAIGGAEVTMYVNVDCNSSNVLFMQGNTLLMQRAFTFGGDDMILGYMNAAGKDGGDYVAALTECSSEDAEVLASPFITAALQSDPLARMVSSIVRTMDYFNSNRWDKPVERVVLMGPCSHLAGLQAMVADNTGLDTVYLDVLEGVSSFANAAESASFFISCLGSSIEPLDFIPPQFKQDRKKKKDKGDKKNSIVGGVVICVACIAAAVVMSMFAITNYNLALQEKAAMEKKVASLQYTRDVYSTYLDYQSSAAQLVAVTSMTETPNDSLSAFIAELEEKMPSEIIILSASCGKTLVSMNLTVPGYEEAAVVLVQLRSFESLCDIFISSIAKQIDEAGGEYVAFAVNCRYAVPETEAEAAD